MTALTPASSPRTGAELRLPRAAVFTAVCVALSAGGHIMASNATVPLWYLGIATAVVLAVALPLSGRQRSLPGIAALLAVGQTGLHCLFGIGQHAAAGPSDTMSLARRILCNDPGMALSEGRAQQIVANSGIDPTKSGAAEHIGHSGSTGTTAVLDTAAYSLPMLLGHVLAALAVAWLLRRGDVAVTALLRAAADAELRPVRAALAYAWALLAGLLTDPTPGPAVPIRAEADARTAPAAVVLQHSVVRRGPPDLGRVSKVASSARSAGPAASGAVHRKAEGRPRTGRTRAIPTTRRGAVPGVAGQTGLSKHGLALAA